MTVHAPVGAVVFDLFHTLIDTEHLRPNGFDAITTVAELCDLEPAPLRAFWDATYIERETSVLELTDLLERYCHQVGRPLTPELRSAADETFGTCKDDALRRPDPEMITLFAGLASAVPIGVLSNCHEREVRCWDESPFAPLTSSFGRSTRIGAMKPEPVVYRWVLDELDLVPSEAVYVGNGSSDELAGADRVGFGTVVHCNVFDRSNGLVDHGEQCRRAAQANVSVDTIAELDDVLTDLVGRGNITR